MGGSLKLGTIAGIGIYVHWTFALLIGWVAFEGGGLSTSLWRVLLMFAIFGCIVLHELGHALTARLYGIPTRDITLLPIGGVARLERMPDVPLQELWVALAGPAVNVVIAACLIAWLVVSSLLGWNFGEGPAEESLPVQLLIVNIGLILFNLLPAFPMDGGRVLRALLATQLNYVRATEIAAAVGQAMAVLFAVLTIVGGAVGFGFNPFLLLVALFVYVGARDELRMVQMKSAFRGVPVRAAMMTRFATLAPTDTLGAACDELFAGAQQDFPVLSNQQVVGMVSRAALLKAVGELGPEAQVAQVMRSDCPTVQESEMLERTFLAMRQSNCTTLPVLRNRELVGLITLENVGELVMAQTALHNGQSQHDAAPWNATQQ